MHSPSTAHWTDHCVGYYRGFVGLGFSNLHLGILPIASAPSVCVCVCECHLFVCLEFHLCGGELCFFMLVCCLPRLEPRTDALVLSCFLVLGCLAQQQQLFSLAVGYHGASGAGYLLAPLLLECGGCSYLLCLVDQTSAVCLPSLEPRRLTHRPSHQPSHRPSKKELSQLHVSV